MKRLWTEASMVTPTDKRCGSSEGPYLGMNVTTARTMTVRGICLEISSAVAKGHKQT